VTIKELRKVTKCRIFVEQTDMDGAVRRTEWLGATRDYQIASIKIIHAELVGFALCVTIEEAGA